jgi:hypothetical protein
MSRILKHVIIAGLLAGNAGISPASAQVVRARPVITPTGPVKPTIVTQVRPLTQAELASRMKPAPRFLTASELKARVPANNAASAIPDLKSAFSLTPAVQSVEGRGSMSVAGQLYLPDPSPPGFPGQAIIRRGATGGIGQASFTGGVFMQINMVKDTYYVLDCLAAMRGSSGYVNYTINSSSPNASPLQMSISDGRFLLTIPKQKQDRISQISFYPDFYSEANKGPEMDFWGCQISSGG